MLMQSEIAGIGRRLLATVLDLIILHTALALVTRDMRLPPVALWMLDYAIAVCYSAIFLVLRGQTPGKMILRLRVIPMDGGMVAVGQGFLRAVLKWTPIFGLFILLAWVAPEELRRATAGGQMMDQVEIDPQSAIASSVLMVVGTVGWLVLIHTARRHPDGQGMHDRVAQTCVIQAP